MDPSKLYPQDVDAIAIAAPDDWTATTAPNAPYNALLDAILMLRRNIEGRLYDQTRRGELSGRGLARAARQLRAIEDMEMLAEMFR